MDQFSTDNAKRRLTIINYGRRSRFRRLRLRFLITTVVIGISVILPSYFYYRRNAVRLNLLYMQWRVAKFDAPHNEIAYQLDEPFFLDDKKLSSETPDCLKLLNLPGYTFDDHEQIRPYGFDVWYNVDLWDRYVRDFALRSGENPRYFQSLNLLFLHDRSSACGHRIVGVVRGATLLGDATPENRLKINLCLVPVAFTPATLHSDEQMMHFPGLLLQFHTAAHLIFQFGQVDPADDGGFYIPYTANGQPYKILGRLNDNGSVTLVDTRVTPSFSKP